MPLTTKRLRPDISYVGFKYWRRFWMRFADLSPFGRLATRLASAFAPPFYDRQSLKQLSPTGYVSPKAVIHHANLRLSKGIFIDDGVLIYQDKEGGAVKLSENVLIYRDTIIQTGTGGSVAIGTSSSIQPRCQLSAYKSPIKIGSYVQIAPNCSFYSYDHSFGLGELILKQPLKTRGGIVIGDDVWIGVGVIILDGVKVGKGAVVGAGSVVIKDIPDHAIAVGNPARVVKMRGDLS